MADRVAAAETYPPGEYLKDELEARGWTQADLAEIIARPPRVVSEIVNGRRAITPETARGLGEAFGTGAEIWLNLESIYQLSKIDTGDTTTIAKRARLYEVAPVKELERRHWIVGSANPNVLEATLAAFFGVDSLESIAWKHAARKSTPYDEPANAAQMAWLSRARQLAPAVDAAPYHSTNFAQVLGHLTNLTDSVEGVRHVPRVLAEGGIRLLVVEHLSGTKIDGATLWLDDRSPVVVLSLRFDRIDNFWFTLMHEMDHVQHGDGSEVGHVDSGIEEARTDLPKIEKRANSFAQNFLIPQDEMERFIARTSPIFTPERINLFSRRVGVHPGIIVGQLQKRGELPWTHGNKMKVKVRHVITRATLADGWGYAPPITAGR